ncbi:MAG: sel1 repeat family protein [Myxococcales bacterium]|nr:sel1 repeat family protein [Myxococcales bacterium]
MERHRRLDRAAAGALTLLATLALAAAAQAQPAEDCTGDCATLYWVMALTEDYVAGTEAGTQAPASPPPSVAPLRATPSVTAPSLAPGARLKALGVTGPATGATRPALECGLNCAQGYLRAVDHLRQTDPKGTQLYDSLTFEKKPVPAAPRPALRPASGRLAALRAKPTVNTGAAKPGELTFKAPPKRKPLTFEQMLRRAPKKPTRLLAPKPFLATASAAPARPLGDLGGPLDRTACNQGDAEACNRVGRVYWDRLKPPAHDKQQLDTLRDAKDWYGKACDAGKETACWEAIGLLQRLQKARPNPLGF